jgi:hypothetical protein
MMQGGNGGGTCIRTYLFLGISAIIAVLVLHEVSIDSESSSTSNVLLEAAQPAAHGKLNLKTAETMLAKAKVAQRKAARIAAKKQSAQRAATRHIKRAVRRAESAARRKASRRAIRRHVTRHTMALMIWKYQKLARMHVLAQMQKRAQRHGLDHAKQRVQKACKGKVTKRCAAAQKQLKHMTGLIQRAAAHMIKNQKQFLARLDKKTKHAQAKNLKLALHLKKLAMIVSFRQRLVRHAKIRALRREVKRAQRKANRVQRELTQQQKNLLKLKTKYMRAKLKTKKATMCVKKCKARVKALALQALRPPKSDKARIALGKKRAQSGERFVAGNQKDCEATKEGKQETPRTPTATHQSAIHQTKIATVAACRETCSEAGVPHAAVLCAEEEGEDAWET